MKNQLRERGNQLKDGLCNNLLSGDSKRKVSSSTLLLLFSPLYCDHLGNLNLANFFFPYMKKSIDVLLWCLLHNQNRK